jgi:hypothetical protein
MVEVEWQAPLAGLGLLSLVGSKMTLVGGECKVG